MFLDTEGPDVCRKTIPHASIVLQKQCSIQKSGPGSLSDAAFNSKHIQRCRVYKQHDGDEIQVERRPDLETTTDEKTAKLDGSGISVGIEEKPGDQETAEDKK